jgi:PAS domain S-box-containing protein
MTSDLLATISLDGRFTLLNPAWEQLLGWTREELRELPIRQFVHPDDAEQALGQLLDRDGSTGELRTSPRATSTATARGAGCCGAPAATATAGTRRPRT